MSDFSQRGPIVTLPRLGRRDLERFERELTNFTRERKLALLLPCLVSELEGPALPQMLRELAQAPFLDTVLVCLDKASPEAFAAARGYFQTLPKRTVLLWVDAPAILGLVQEVEQSVGRQLVTGKGRAVWLGLGYLLAEGRTFYVALHDADVLNYHRSLLANLVAPVVHPALYFEFSKAFYARFADRLYGRATRLLVTPLLKAMADLLGRQPYLSYLAAFRYPLAGEMAFPLELARWLRIPGDWGLEVGLLFELIRYRSPRRICQVDVADSFDHKHQDLSPEDPTRGLHRMAVDVVQHLLRTAASSGVAMNEGTFGSLQVAFKRHAEDAVATSYAVAVFNGLVYDRHEEEQAVEVFAKALAEACRSFRENPLGVAAFPNWERVVAAIPSLPLRLVEAVRETGGVLVE